MARSSPRSTFTSGLELAAALALVAAPLTAHSLHQHRGEALVEPERVLVGVDLSNEHGGRSELDDEIVVRDAEGERLMGRVTASSDEVRIEYETPLRPSHLVFQLLPRTAGPERRRLALTVRSQGLARERILTLTSGGNAEVVSFDWSGHHPEPSCGPGALDADGGRLDSVRALLRLDGSIARLDVVVPVRLVETWLPLPRHEHDWLAPEEQDEAREGLAELVRGRSILRAGGRAVGPASVAVAFLSLDDEALDETTARRRLSAWTGRVRVSQTFPAGEAVELEWDLFNAAVLTADVFVVAQGECSRHRLSTYAPRLHWPP